MSKSSRTWGFVVVRHGKTEKQIAKNKKVNKSFFKNVAAKNTEITADYQDILNAGQQRQKQLDQEQNNQIRDTYMSKLLLPQKHSSDLSTYESNSEQSLRDTGLLSQQSTPSLKQRKNIDSSRSSASPSRAVTVKFGNAGLSESDQNNSMSSFNAYLNTRPTTSVGLSSQKSDKLQISRDKSPYGSMAKTQTESNSIPSLSKIQVSELRGNTETPYMTPVVEVTTTDIGNETNDELFKHLSYLSILHKETQHFQQVEVEGPLDYNLEYIDPSQLLDHKQNQKQLEEPQKRTGRFNDNSNTVLTDICNGRPQRGCSEGAVQMKILKISNTQITSQEAGEKKAELRSVSRSGQQIRNQFLAQLTYKKVWLRPAEKPQTHQTCIIFDWDDTILCTTFLAPHTQLIYDQTVQFPASLKTKLQQLDEVAVSLIKKSKQLGKVYIVTNAAEGWVELSAKRFLPLVNAELHSNIEIISARTKYEHLYPRNYQKWKVEAFLETKKDMDEQTMTNLIALGDNVFEIEAAYILGAQFTKAFIKTVKFRMSPSTTELIKQLKLVDSQFENICNSPKNLTVRLLRQTKEEAVQEQASKAGQQVECDAATAASTAIMQQLNQKALL